MAVSENALKGIMITKKIALGCDHTGPKLKNKIKSELESMGAQILDFGTDGNESVDYTDYAEKVSQAIINGDADMGVLICGSGVGISIAANRHREIRAANCINEEMASLARKHNNANVLALGARFVDTDTALKCLKTFFSTKFEGGRHERRVEKMS